MAHLSFRQVRKEYPGATIIEGLDLEVEDGEFIVIVGPSGCGKSTLLRMMAGLETVSAGKIAIDGKVVNELEPAERDIAMVFQNYALYPHMTVYENMAYGLKIRGHGKKDIQARVEEAARILELEKLLQRKPRQLSGGQRQRVAMGRAIVRHPKAFLFDEPLSNLDAKLRVQMRLEIQKLHRRLKTTSLYVTHDQVEAMTLAHRMVIMNQGEVEQIGTPREVYDHPASTFVASFIGSPPMNLIKVHIDSHHDIALPGGNWMSARQIQVPYAAIRQDCILGVRPEDLRISNMLPADSPSHPEEGMWICVEMVESLGAECLIHGRLGQTAVVLRRPDDLVDGEQIEIGAWLRLKLDAERPLHWFNLQTGKRLPDNTEQEGEDGDEEDGLDNSLTDSEDADRHGNASTRASTIQTPAEGT